MYVSKFKTLHFRLEGKPGAVFSNVIGSEINNGLDVDFRMRVC
jgi:hypothetical protein